MANELDSGEYAVRINALARTVAHAIAAGQIHPANIDAILLAIDQWRLAQARRDHIPLDRVEGDASGLAGARGTTSTPQPATGTTAPTPYRPVTPTPPV